VLAKRIPRAQFLRFVRQLLARLRVCALAQRLNARVDLGGDGLCLARCRCERRAVLGQVFVFCQRGCDGGAALLVLRDCGADSLRFGLVFQSQFFNRFLNRVRGGLEGSESIAPAGEVIPDLAQFFFRGRSDEILKLLEPVRGGVVEVLLTEDAFRAVFRDRKRLSQISVLLGKGS